MSHARKKKINISIYLTIEFILCRLLFVLLIYYISLNYYFQGGLNNLVTFLSLPYRIVNTTHVLIYNLFKLLVLPNYIISSCKNIGMSDRLNATYIF